MIIGLILFLYDGKVWAFMTIIWGLDDSFVYDLIFELFFKFFYFFELIDFLIAFLSDVE